MILVRLAHCLILKHLDMDIIFRMLITFLIWKSCAYKQVDVYGFKLGIPKLLQHI